jgi:hypothetical protein
MQICMSYGNTYTNLLCRGHLSHARVDGPARIVFIPYADPAPYGSMYFNVAAPV